MVRLKAEREVEAVVQITVNDSAPDDWLSEAIKPGGERNYYGFETEEDVLDHFAYNAVFNGVTGAAELDGWGDLDPFDIIFTVR
jgi:hypothetical protein